MDRIGVITGDIINSRLKLAQEWQPILTDTLERYGEEPVDWELFRGDSFQLRVAPENALLATIHIKAGIKQVNPLDVRMAIGIGTEDYTANKVTASTGTAFILSGQCFDTLKRQTMAIALADKSRETVLNLMLTLACLTMDNWSPAAAEAIKMAIENPDMNQEMLAKSMGKSQSSISEALKRGGYDAVVRMIEFYRQDITRS